MGDLWAGAEVQLLTLAAELAKSSQLALDIILFNEGRLADELRTLGLPVTVYPESSLGTWQLLGAVTDYCRPKQFDLLHVHKYKDTLVGALTAMRCCVPRVVRTVHGLSEPFAGVQAMKMYAYEAVDGAIIKAKVDRVICVSAQITEALQGRYGRDRVRQIHNGIRLETVVARVGREAICSRIGVQPHAQLVGIVGRLTAVKGHADFLVAAESVARQCAQAEFVVVGDGPLLPTLKAQAASLGIAGRVHFVGHRDDTYDFMRALDAFVLPSLHEGIPMVLLEAMALSRPIIASDVGGIPEVIRRDIDGILVPARNPGAVASACLSVLTDTLRAAQLGASARTRVEQSFSAGAMAAQVLGLYQELVPRSA